MELLTGANSNENTVSPAGGPRERFVSSEVPDSHNGSTRWYYCVCFTEEETEYGYETKVTSLVHDRAWMRSQAVRLQCPGCFHERISFLAHKGLRP